MIVPSGVAQIVSANWPGSLSIARLTARRSSGASSLAAIATIRSNRKTGSGTVVFLRGYEVPLLSRMRWLTSGNGRGWPLGHRRGVI